MSIGEFDTTFEALTGHAPFPWQQKLYEQWLRDGHPPRVCDIPTGLGKTSVIAVWLLVLAAMPAKTPRRLVYVVNRRTIVDQTTEESIRYRAALAESSVLSGVSDSLRALCSEKRHALDSPLAISTLRGQFADNRKWSADPARPAVVAGTVDMVGSRLLFGGYRIGFKARPLNAGFLGQDALLVHDEAHLEPAFQVLVETIAREQGDEAREGGTPWSSLSVMVLSATTRTDSNGEGGGSTTFGLTDAEMRPPARIPDPPIKPIDHVWRRLCAKKTLYLHPVATEKDSPAKICDLALDHSDSGRSVLVFARTVDDVRRVSDRLRSKESGVDEHHVRILTGTMRGHERDELVNDGTFRRFLPDPPNDCTVGTVYLACTSAGEVGVNLSADHLVCDLSTFDSMVQRFGRVNRFGDRNDTRIDVVHPESFGEKKPNPQREITLGLLEQLDGDASPRALGDLPLDQRSRGFAPEPTILPATDILFDAWALTTIRGDLPGRPPLAPYLHGKAEWEPPRTSIAWRDEVAIIGDDLIERHERSPTRGRFATVDLPRTLLEDYPLKPHELLNDRTDRVYSTLDRLLRRSRERASARIWLVDEDNGSVSVMTLGELMRGDKRRVVDRLDSRTVLLSPSIGGFMDGLFNPDSDRASDVADQWFDEQSRQRRERRFSDEAEPASIPDQMVLVRSIDLRPLADETMPAASESEFDGEAASTGEIVYPALGRFWHWYVRPNATDDAAPASTRPIGWEQHTRDVVRRAAAIVSALDLPEELQDAVVIAAELHDLGKKREIWQRSIGNPDPTDWHAKPGKPINGPRWRSRWLSGYRHELGSLLDAMDAGSETDSALAQLSPEMQEVVLHLIAAHHGYARPHFPVRAYDYERHSTEENERAVSDSMRRYVRLQRRYGRWGLAYLESLLRAPDWAASAKPAPANLGKNP